MHPFLRGLVGVVAGLIVGALLVFALQMVSHVMFAPDTPIDRNDRAAVERFIAGLPIGAFLMVLLSYFIGTLVGSSTAARIGRSLLPSIIVTLLLFGAAISNLIMIPHPWWMVVAVPTVYAVAGFIAWKLSSDLRAAAAA
jgi:hypothetical protein